MKAYEKSVELEPNRMHQDGLEMVTHDDLGFLFISWPLKVCHNLLFCTIPSVSRPETNCSVKLPQVLLGLEEEDWKICLREWKGGEVCPLEGLAEC